MAIPSKGFEVIFSQKCGEKDRFLPLDRFFTNEFDILQKREENFIEIKENIELTVTFSSNRDDAKFFMDGLEALPEPKLHVDPLEREVYLAPSEKPVALFDNTKAYYPLIPGLYRIMVVCDEQRYFSGVKVIPKQIEETQWEIMKEEIEKEVSGLAREVILQKNGLNHRLGAISQGLLEQFIVINNRFPSVMAALSDLYRKVNYRISKDYQVVPKEKARFVDEKTIRHCGSNPNRNQVLMTPRNSINYDLLENRFVKKIIISISKTLTGFMEGVQNSEINIRNSKDAGPFRTVVEKERTLSELKKLGEVAGKMRGAIQWIKTAPWFERIGTYQFSDIPPVMNSDPRYRALYQLYRELKNEQFQLQIHHSYSYQWKRTDKLYEIWGYLQFIKALAGEELGFVPEKGWLYSQTPDGNSLLVPTLPANTEVEFRKDELRVHLVYEALLPSQSRLTTMKEPLYTRGTHNCPDGRLDVYRNERFIGTIIFDFKYRPRNSIWNENLIVNNQRNEVMQQLVSYGDHLHSPYLFGDGSHPLVSTMSPVQEVWAIYPNRYGTCGSKDYPDHKVSLIELTPGLDHAYFVEKLKLTIDKLVQRSRTVMEFLDYIKV
ncbi:DUF2357 domain-containing protein [Neobacillus drentensis]|uniref:DUF2357 domain-containing protein n=1 Tax=Neobacillus drentensis TaxID=220684 RepID=UPI000824A8AF|nr:DUF2357 domain-containing protein [Neobacillus drentensis]